jgi:hypothetical protein
VILHTSLIHLTLCAHSDDRAFYHERTILKTVAKPVLYIQKSCTTIKRAKPYTPHTPRHNIYVPSSYCKGYCGRKALRRQEKPAGLSQ